MSLNRPEAPTEGSLKPEPTEARPLGRRDAATGYMPIEDYGLIGNMRTAALIGIDGGLDYLCWPNFDSPSIFCRILDSKNGGHFTITPSKNALWTTKQQYLPSSNILETVFYSEEGVIKLVDFFPRPHKVAPAEPLRPHKDNADADTDPVPSLRK